MNKGVAAAILFTILVVFGAALWAREVGADDALILPYGGNATIIGETAYSSITGLGRNSLTIINSTLQVGYISLKGGGNSSILITNSTVAGLMRPMTFNNYGNFTVSSVSVGFAGDSTALVLRNIRNGSVTGFNYIYTQSATTTNMAAISIEGCTNLTLSGVRGIGLADVRTPHFHVSFAGVTPSLNVTVSESYFYGGGNGGTSSNVRYVNCTWDTIVDGTEIQKLGVAEFVNCTWLNIKDSEINLQKGVQFRFVDCAFGKGLFNAANGYAELVNCTAPAWMWCEMRDSDNVAKYLGRATINGAEYSWVRAGKYYAASVVPTS